MKKRFLHHLGFAGKSLMWSLFLYTFLMVCINWDDVSNGFKKYRNDSFASNIITPPPADASAQTKNDDSHKHSATFAAIKTVADLLVNLVSFKTR